MSKNKTEANKIEFDKSLFDDERTRLARHHVKEDDETAKPVTLAADGTVELATEQLRIALDDLEQSALSVLNREAITIPTAVTMPANTPAGRAGRIAAGVQAVRRTLVSPEAAEAALTMYRMMQQFAAASVDEWREEVRRGVGSVEHQHKAAGSDKRSKACEAAATFFVGKFGSDKKPSRIWAKVRYDAEQKPLKWDVVGMVVKISADGKNISCGVDSRTKAVFLKSYLKPAREAAAKG